GQPAPAKKHSGHAHHEIHESPAIMTLPLVFLAVLSVFGGFLGIPNLIFPQAEHPSLNMQVAVISSVIAVLVLALSYTVYIKRPAVEPLQKMLGPLYTLLKNKYYFDTVYGWYVDSIQQGVAMVLEWLEDLIIVRLGVLGLAGAARAAGNVLRYLQAGL